MHTGQRRQHGGAAGPAHSPPDLTVRSQRPNACRARRCAWGCLGTGPPAADRAGVLLPLRVQRYDAVVPRVRSPAGQRARGPVVGARSRVRDRFPDIPGDSRAARYGRSEGEPTEDGLRLDSQAALKFLLQHPDIDGSKIVAYGQSLGGAVAIDLVARNPGAVRACGECDAPRGGGGGGGGGALACTMAS